MASHLFNYFKLNQAEDDIELSTAAIYAALAMSDTTADTENDGIEFMDDFSDLDEHNGSGYGRVELSGVSIVLDETNDRAELHCNDITFPSLGAGSRAVAGMVLHVDADDDGDPADDAANYVIGWNEFSGSPDGNDFVVEPNAEGLLQLA